MFSKHLGSVPGPRSSGLALTHTKYARHVELNCAGFVEALDELGKPSSAHEAVLVRCRQVV